MNGERLCNIPLRVCFYARVSTDSDVQLNSLLNQQDYYQKYIQSKSCWTYIRGYIDEGISGVRVDKREAFKEMIRDAKLHQFDLIITKEVSRFARDLEDSIHYIRILKENDVGIYFENQNLNTFDANSELILNIMFNLAQDESRKLSSRVKFGHLEAMKKGHVLGSSNILGYKKHNCKLMIVEKEAKIVQKIFELYSTGHYGLLKLSIKLGELGIYNSRGNLYDKDTLKRIIGNPKYKGFYRGKTTETVDYRTKKRVKIGKEEQIVYKSDENSIPPIVSSELWDKANEILNSRTKFFPIDKYSSGSLKYPFSSKIYCAEHNVRFQRSCSKRQKKRPVWSCGRYLQYRLEACGSPIIAESDLYYIFFEIMKKTISDENLILEDLLKLYSSINQSNQYLLELKEINKDMEIIENKKSMVLDFIFSGKLRKEELEVQFKRFEIDLQSLNIRRRKLLEQMSILENGKKSMVKIVNSIKEELNGGLLEEFIRKFVDEVIVFKINDNRHDIKLDIYINLTGDEFSKNKGAKHIGGATTHDVSFLLNNEYISVENMRRDREKNKFICNVYVETLS